MVTLECADCGKEKEFPSRLTVVRSEIEGWELDVREEEEKLIVENAYCRDCQKSE